MPAAPLDVVRSHWSAWERRDMRALFALYHPGVTWDQRRAPGGSLAGSGIFHGHSGIRSFFLEWMSDFEDYWARPLEFEAFGDVVLVRYAQGGRGRSSGVEVEMPDVWQTYVVRDGLIVAIRVFADRAEALAATRP